MSAADMKVRNVRLWFVEGVDSELWCWCFTATNATGGHVVSGRVFWDGLYSSRLWSKDRLAVEEDMLRDTRHAFAGDAHSSDVQVVVVDQ